MSDKPPIQKPPVRMPGGPSYPVHQPPPQPIYAPIVQQVPVYVPIPPPYEPSTTAPMTSFVSFLGWVSLIWAIGMVTLGFALRFALMDSLGESLATVSMWLSVVLIPLGMIGGLFALFELGREVTADCPKPTFARLFVVALMVCGGVGGQVWFSHYLTESAALALAGRVHGSWQRIAAATNQQHGGPWNMQGAMKVSDEFGHDEHEDSATGEPTDIVIDFTRGGTVELHRPGIKVAEQFSYITTNASTIQLRRPHAEDVSVEFLANGEMLLSVKDWWRQSDVLGRYRRVGDPDLGPDLDPAIAGPWAESLTKLRTELATHEQKVKNLAKLSSQLEIEKRDRTKELNGYGVFSSADLEGKGQAPRELSKELVDIGRQMEITRRKLDDSQGMIVKIKSTLRQIGRRIRLAKAEMSSEDDEKLVQAKVLLADLSEQLGDRSTTDKEVNAINEQVMLDKVLKEQVPDSLHK